MLLDEDDLKRGLIFIVGTWQVDFLVNAWSKDLAHIPATEFKSEDGTDFTAINFEFFEDHTVVMKDTSKGKEVNGTWKQTGFSEFHYTLNDFIDIPDSQFKKNAETLNMIDGNLAFSIGFLSVNLKKTAEGKVTEEADIGDIPMSDEDAARLDIAGDYEVIRIFSVVNDTPGMYTRQEIEEELKKRIAAGELDESELADMTKLFDSTVEITESHKIKTWMKMPENVPEEEIKKAIESGKIEDCDGERFCAHSQPWKSIGGKFYYDTGEHREVFGEVKSSWDEIAFDEDGLMTFMSGMAKLRKL